MELRIQLLLKEAKLPAFAHTTDAGMDLYCGEAVTIAPGQRAQVRTGVALGIEEGFVGLIWDKSGISHKAGLKTLGGVIDSGYTGEVLVGIYNTGDTAHTFAVGDKVAQILIQRIEHPEILEVESLEGTARGANGFGSTGS
jgi:dUTP pyrophosphatase